MDILGEAGIDLPAVTIFKEETMRRIKVLPQVESGVVRYAVRLRVEQLRIVASAVLNRAERC